MDISHRKVKKQIRFTDAAGAALADKQISIKQTNHSFLFGCGAFDFMGAANGFEEAKKLTDKWLKVFNYGTLPFYWGMFEREEGKPNTEGMMKAAKYLQERNVKVRSCPLPLSPSANSPHTWTLFRRKTSGSFFPLISLVRD